FFLQRYAHHPHLPSFPTRRSSDLSTATESSSKRAASAGTRAINPIPHRERTSHERARATLHASEQCVTRRHPRARARQGRRHRRDRKSTRLNSSHRTISYAVFCLK